MVVQLPMCYDIYTISDFMDIVKNKNKYIGISYLIIDGYIFKEFSDGGAECYIVKSELNIKEIIFVNIPEAILALFNIFSNTYENRDIIEFNNIEDAMNYINKLKLTGN